MGVLSIETVGWLAAGLTAATFACTDMRRLRGLALAANLAFIAYGAAAALAPVLVLHLVLAPLNAWRLWQLRRGIASPLRAPERPASAVPRAATPLRARVRRRPPEGRRSAPRPALRVTDGRPARHCASPVRGGRP